jgi:3-oxoacyl-[acyl-carrier-protein] synthase II
MEAERVVITGLGTINAVAADVPAFTAALRRGTCGIGPVSAFDPRQYATATGGQAPAFDLRDRLPGPLALRRMSRADRMALAATREALGAAGLWPLPEPLRERAGVVIGGGAGGMLEAEAVYRDYLRERTRGLAFSRFAAFCCAASADHIATHLGLMGPKTTFMTACSSGATAIGYGRDLIADGAADLVIAGGTEPLSRTTYAAFNALKAVDPEPCKPFDKHRRGLSLGEGAGILILESLALARRRGARILGEVLGYGVSGDAHHMTAPDPEASGAVRCIRAALADAGVRPEQVDYVNAHGTATPANDRMETKALKAVFGRRAFAIPVSSTKAMTGHTLGAAGAIEGVVSVLAIAHGLVPPTIHLETADPECDLDYVPGTARAVDLSIVLSNSFAFGGNNTAVVFGRYTPRGAAHD